MRLVLLRVQSRQAEAGKAILARLLATRLLLRFKERGDAAPRELPTPAPAGHD